MVLKFKSHDNDPKKILIYGLHGSGKSTFATEYCENQGWNYCIIDVDDTNYTSNMLVDIDMTGSSSTVYKNTLDMIAEIKNDDDIDTIIFDGVSSFLGKITPAENPRNKYFHHGKKAERWDNIVEALVDSGCNIIFIGQIDMEVYYDEEIRTPRPIRTVTEITNDIYRCERDKDGKILPVVHVKTRNRKGAQS